MWQGDFMLKSSTTWAQSRTIKRRHFFIEGGQLKLYGRRGRTFKGSIVLAAVSAVRPTVDPTAPAGAVELEADSSRGAAAVAAAAAASAVAAAAAKAAGLATGTTPPAADDSALAAMERRRLARPAAQHGGFGSYAVTFVIAADAADAAPFLEALRAAVPEAATSELQLQARVSRWAGAGLAPEDYTLGRTVGAGTFGKVKLAVGPDGREVAIKILSRSRLIGHNQLGRLTQEISILRCLRHPHVIALEAVHHLPAAIWMVLEYMPGGDLLTLLNEKAKHRRRLTEREAQSIFGQVVSAVAFCHSLGVAHRDLKPENILVNQIPDPTRPEPTLEPRASAASAAAGVAAGAAGGEGGEGAAGAAECFYAVKVADFGLSTLMHAGEFLRTQCGSPHYVAPEVLNFETSTSYDGCEADVWSLGVILHVLLTSRLPFEGDNTAQLYARIRAGLTRVPSRAPPLAGQLLSQILIVQPARRLTTAQIAAHAWLDDPDELAAAGALLAHGAPTHGAGGAARLDADGAAATAATHLERLDSIDSHLLAAAARRARADAARAAETLALAVTTTLCSSPPAQPGDDPSSGARARLALQRAASPQPAPAGRGRCVVALSQLVDALVDVDATTLRRVVGGGMAHAHAQARHQAEHAAERERRAAAPTRIVVDTAPTAGGAAAAASGGGAPPGAGLVAAALGAK